MNTLATTNQGITSEYFNEVLAGVLFLARYQRKRDDDPTLAQLSDPRLEVQNREYVSGLALLLNQAGVRVEDIREAAVLWMEKDKWYPAPRDLIECARSVRERKYYRERDEEASRKAADAKNMTKPPMTREELKAFRRDVLAGMKEGPRNLFLSLYNEDGSPKTEEQDSNVELSREEQIKRLHADDDPFAFEEAEKV